MAIGRFLFFKGNMKRLTAILSILFISIYFAVSQASLPKTIYKAADEEEEYNNEDSSEDSNDNDDDDDDYYDDDDDYIEDNISFGSDMNLPGDQFIKIAIGLDFPLNFPNPIKVFKGNAQLSIGGFGSLGYHYFLKSFLAVGFDVGFGFNVSIGSHIFNYVPIIINATYQPTVGRFEFPLTLGIGAAWESFSGSNYFPGLVVKPEAGAMFRITSSWSLGLEMAYLLMPQFSSWYHSDAKSFAGQFFTISAAARYHF